MPVCTCIATYINSAWDDDGRPLQQVRELVVIDPTCINPIHRRKAEYLEA